MFDMSPDGRGLDFWIITDLSQFDFHFFIEYIDFC